MKVHLQIAQAQIQLRSFVDFCNRSSPSVCATGCTPEMLANIAKIERWMKAFMDARQPRRVEQRDTEGNV